MNLEAVKKQINKRQSKSSGHPTNHLQQHNHGDSQILHVQENGYIITWI